MTVICSRNGGKGSKKNSSYFWFALFMVMALLFPSAVEAAGDKSSVTTFGKFTLTITPEVKKAYSVLLAYKEAPVHFPTEVFARFSIDSVHKEFPKKGCETVKVNLFTGGDDCCFANYLLTTCGEEDFAAYFSPLREIEKSSVSNTYMIRDPFFMYYTVEFPETGAKITLTKAGSPTPFRLLVLGSAGWRPDKPGEYRDFYLDLATRHFDATLKNTLTGALLRAYYLNMAGEPYDEVFLQFQEELPREFYPLSAQLYKDVLGAIKLFSPVTSIGLQ